MKWFQNLEEAVLRVLDMGREEFLLYVEQKGGKVK